MSLTCLPTCVSQCLRVLGPCFRHRHHLVFSWLLVLHLIYGERANLKALARLDPGHLAYHHYRRLLCAAYWCTKAQTASQHCLRQCGTKPTVLDERNPSGLRMLALSL